MKIKYYKEEKEIDKKIQKAKNNGVSMAFLARKLGVSRQRFHCIIVGKIAIEEKTYLKLNKLL